MTFDRTEEYEKYIEPQLVGLKKLCVKYHVPFFFAVCIANNDKESVYKKDMYSGLAKGLDLTDDYFPDLAKITLGFTAQPPVETMSFSPEELCGLPDALNDFNEFGDEDDDG